MPARLAESLSDRQVFLCDTSDRYWAAQSTAAHSKNFGMVNIRSTVWEIGNNRIELYKGFSIATRHTAYDGKQCPHSVQSSVERMEATARLLG